MSHGRGGVWARRGRAGATLAAILAAAGCSRTDQAAAPANPPPAASAADAGRWADRLADQGDAGAAKLVKGLASDRPETVAAARAGLEKLLADPERPTFPGTAGKLMNAFPALPDAGRAAVLGLVPAMLKRADPVLADRCRAAVAAALAAPAAGPRLVAVRAALHPALGLKRDLVPLLDAPEPDVRRAALFAVGPAVEGDDPVVDDDALCRWLHDPDEGVRNACRDALLSRGRTDGQIALARRLTHPDAGERLKLLLDLRWADDEVKDPAPWLAWLGRDPDPAVRAGAARVCAERGIAAPWVAQLADADPDPTVRRVAAYYRDRQAKRAAEANGVRQASGESR